MEVVGDFGEERLGVIDIGYEPVLIAMNQTVRAGMRASSLASEGRSCEIASASAVDDPLVSEPGILI
jgi:hypothetical protein